MTYNEVEAYKLNLPQSTFEKFEQSVSTIASDFINGNEIIGLIENGKITIDHFHNLLLTIFHQVYIAGSTTLALGGVMTDNRNSKFREYFFHHAEEEQDHWKWIIQNLRDTGYTGPDPREMFPQYPTQAYLSFAVHFSLKYPQESLAIAYVLESISSQLGVKYGSKAAQILNLNKETMSFFLLHGELDEGHEADILEMLKSAAFSPYQWAIAEYAAKATVHYYKAMYNHAAKMTKDNLVTT